MNTSRYPRISIFCCLWLLPIIADAQPNFFVGTVGVNRYVTGFGNRYGHYDIFKETPADAFVLNAGLAWVEGRSRKSLQLSLINRASAITTSMRNNLGRRSDALHEIDLKLTHVSLASCVGTYFSDRGFPLYVDVGAYLDIPLRRELTDVFTITYSELYSQNNTMETNTDADVYLKKIELGVLLEIGFLLRMNDATALVTAWRGRCGVGGKADFNRLAFDRQYLLGVQQRL